MAYLPHLLCGKHVLHWGWIVLDGTRFGLQVQGSSDVQKNLSHNYYQLNERQVLHFTTRSRYQFKEEQLKLDSSAIS